MSSEKQQPLPPPYVAASAVAAAAPTNSDVDYNREIAMRKRLNAAYASRGGRGGRRHSSSLSSLDVSVSDHERQRLLDFKDVKAAAGDIRIETYDDFGQPDDAALSDDEVDMIKRNAKLAQEEEKKDEEKKEEEEKKKKKKDSFEPHPKMNTLVGFLRLANYVCACNVAFGISVSIFWPREKGEPEPKYVA